MMSSFSFSTFIFFFIFTPMLEMTLKKDFYKKKYLLLDFENMYFLVLKFHNGYILLFLQNFCFYILD